MPLQVLIPTAAAHDGSEQGSTTTGCTYNGASPGTVEFADTVLRLGFSAQPLNIYIKFPLPSTGWLSGKIINSVTLGMTASSTLSTSLSCSMHFEKVAVPADLVAGAGTYTITSRTRSTAFVLFGPADFGSWASGSTYSFAVVGANSFKTALDEVIAAVGAANIASVALVMRYIGSASGERLFHAQGTANPPSLTIDYGTVSKVDSMQVPVLRRDSRRVSA